MAGTSSVLASDTEGQQMAAHSNNNTGAVKLPITARSISY